MDVRKLPAGLTRAFMWVALATTAVAVGVHLASYGPDEVGPSLMSVALALFPIVFLVFGPAVVVVNLARIPIDRLYAGLAPYVYVLGGAVFIYIFIDFFAMIALLPGQPEQDGSSFYWNDHGSLIPITADAYRMGMMHAARLFSGHELLFFSSAALIAYQIDAIRGGRLSLDAPPRDDAMERTRLPYPLQRVVTLQTTQTPEDCAVRLLSPQLPRSFFDTSRGLRGQASAVGFRLEMASPQTQMVYAVGRFEGERGLTSIRVLLTFKRWPLIGLAVSAVVLPVAWAVAASLGLPLPWFVAVFAVIFTVGGNLLLGLDQRRRLLAQIRRATEAQEIPVI